MFVICIAGVTYAWISWNSDNTRLSGKSGCFPNVNFTNGTKLSSDNVLLFDEDVIIDDGFFLMKEGMTYFDVTASIDSGCNTPVELELDVNVTELSSAFVSGDSTGAFKYALVSYDPDWIDISYAYDKEERLEIIDSNSITSTGIIKFEGLELNTRTNGFAIIFYIDGDMAYNDAGNSTFGCTISGKVVQIAE